MRPPSPLYRHELRAATTLLVVGLTLLTIRIVRQRWFPTPPEASAVRLDINHASRDDLRALVGVGPRTADAIARGRPYERLEELRPLLGPRRFARVRPFLVVTPPATGPSSWRDD